MKAVGGCLQDEWTPTQAWGDIQVTELDNFLASTVTVPLPGNSGVYIITVLFSASCVVAHHKNTHNSVTNHS